jgi:hypothetical protein
MAECIFDNVMWIDVTEGSSKIVLLNNLATGKTNVTDNQNCEGVMR